MPRKEQRRTLLHVMVERVGFRKAYKVSVFTACWLIAREYSPDPISTVDDYARWWRQSRAQAFRDQQLFRACFPEYSTPGELWASLPAPPAIVRDEGQMAAAVMTAAMA